MKWHDPEAMTYYQRIELGKIVQNAAQIDELDYFYRIFAVMNPGKKPDVGDTKAVKYVLSVIAKLEYWCNAEAKLLRTKHPDALAEQAGSKQLGEDLQELLTVYLLGKEFGVAPNSLLLWEYADVFGMLFADKRYNEFQSKYRELMQKKAEEEAKRKNRRKR